jgi:hypothetical protein
MLEPLIRATLEAGSNLRDARDDAVWSFLLPTLDVREAWVVGDAPAGVCAGVRDRAVRLVHVDDIRQLLSLVQHAPIELLVLTSAELARLGASSEDVARIRALLATDASVVVTGTAGRSTVAALGRLLGHQPQVATMEPAPRAGRLLGPRDQTALRVPVRRQRSRARRRLRSAANLSSARVARAIGHAAPLPWVRSHASDLQPLTPRAGSDGSRGGVLIATPRGSDQTALPAWVQQAGAAAGLDWHAAPWRFAPPRGYRSQKPIFLVGADEEGASEHIVKVTQEPRFNDRLLNEAHALRHLAATHLVPAGEVPEVLSTGEHAGLAVVVESYCSGSPFRRWSTGRADCRHAARAVEWFTLLGERSATHTTDADELRRGAETLVRRFAEGFPISARHLAKLREHAAQLTEAVPPAVFLHGDPGVWNLLTRPDGRIAVLDWENAVVEGPPGWDLLLLLTSYAAFVGEAAGRRPTARQIALQFAAGSPLRPLIESAFADYGERVGLSAATMESLIVLCLAHQALKELSRLPHRAAPATHSSELLARVLEAPVLTGSRLRA